MTSRAGSHRRRAFTLPFAAIAGAALLLAACGSSHKATTTSGTGSPAGSNASAKIAGAPASDAAVTLKTATIAGLGTVLVNGSGRTLYVLPTERGGKVTCTSTGGCTTIWPPAVLPAGMSKGIAGNGVQASLLGAVRVAGQIRLTYGGYPLYTFVEDKGPGTATGQGVKDQFGTWWALSPSGTPITRGTRPAPTTTPPTTARASTPAPVPTPTAPPATNPPPPPTTLPPATTTTPPPTTTTVPQPAGAGSRSGARPHQTPGTNLQRTSPR